MAQIHDHPVAGGSQQVETDISDTASESSSIILGRYMTASSVDISRPFDPVHISDYGKLANLSQSYFIATGPSGISDLPPR
jgi:hypothetical protein